jgi:hypothetical protein
MASTSPNAAVKQSAANVGKATRWLTADRQSMRCLVEVVAHHNASIYDSVGFS